MSIGITLPSAKLWEKLIQQTKSELRFCVFPMTVLNVMMAGTPVNCLLLDSNAFDFNVCVEDYLNRLSMYPVLIKCLQQIWLVWTHDRFVMLRSRKMWSCWDKSIASILQLFYKQAIKIYIWNKWKGIHLKNKIHYTWCWTSEDKNKMKRCEIINVSSSPWCKNLS